MCKKNKPPPTGPTARFAYEVQQASKWDEVGARERRAQ
jgi:hypothetical protein